MTGYYEGLVAEFPLVSIEDPLAEDDWAGWAHVTVGPRRAACRSSATTSSSPTPSGSQRGIDEAVANALLVKVNQIGTLTETLDAVRLAHNQRLPLHDEPPLR